MRIACRQHLPALATLANAAAGFAACGLAMTGYPELAALMILVAVLMDSLDGALARALNASSEFGVQFDSMADLISFGCAPALLVGSLLPVGAREIGWVIITVYPLCTAWRLARFNARQVDPAEHADFVGLPSTGAGAAAATGVLLYCRLSQQGLSISLALLPWMLVALGALMVTRIGYKHAGASVSRLRPTVAVLAAAVLVVSAVTWQYEYVFAGLVWGYTLSGPLGVAREKIRAVRHA